MSVTKIEGKNLGDISGKISIHLDSFNSGDYSQKTLNDQLVEAGKKYEEILKTLEDLYF